MMPRFDDCRWHKREEMFGNVRHLCGDPTMAAWAVIDPECCAGCMNYWPEQVIEVRSASLNVPKEIWY